MTTTTDTRAELIRALAVLAEPPGPTHPRLADLLDLPAPTRNEWTEAFVVQLVPHASIYLDADGMLGGPAADRIAGFWRALHLPTLADPDHLGVLLGRYAGLIDAAGREPDAARRALLGQARAALLHEHVLTWLPAYLSAMAEVGPPGYAAWAGLLADTLRAEAAEVGVPDRLPAHLRDAPPPPSDQDSLDTVLRTLLCPARSGLILTRGHLSALARTRGLAARLGDRHRTLRALVEQDPPTILAALAELASGWVDRHREERSATGPIARHWADRAAATSNLLRTGAATPRRYPPAPRPDRHDGKDR
jgi:TorA maturation chaperone TorD